jgi:hypothetical protein
MPKSKPVTMLVSYFPKPRQEKQLLRLLEKHWPTLNRLGLVSPVPPQIWLATDKRTRKRFLIEMFQWKDSRASERAHQLAEVRAIWSPMERILQDMQLTCLEPLA